VPTDPTREGPATARPLLVSASGDELESLLPPPGGPRWLIGITGAPGAGKSTLAAFLAELLGARGAHVPMDGFHLADVELVRQGLRDRKGAPETFDAFGYAALLGRLREGRGHTVYAPGFDRDLEQPLAGAIAVPPEVEVVVSEGNYLLVDRPGWREVRAALDEVWHVQVDEEVRTERLVGRHVEFGKAPAAAQAWVDRVDGPNAALVEACAHRADRLLDLTRWRGRRSSVVPDGADAPRDA
jgi:pantothenate kinase